LVALGRKGVAKKQAGAGVWDSGTGAAMPQGRGVRLLDYFIIDS
jgi:hypothetical protein